MQKTNNERLQTIASAMQELNSRLVYVGGAMAGAYATDPTATEPRTTLDVDCVVDSNSYAEHAAFEELLREKHFQNDHDSEPPVICRWVYNGDLVDVMSMNEQSLSFGNKWYSIGFEHREMYTLPSGQLIYRLPVTYYIATKIDALYSRGGEDWRGAKDFEDIIYVLNYCMEFLDKFHAEKGLVKNYLAEQFAACSLSKRQWQKAMQKLRLYSPIMYPPIYAQQRSSAEVLLAEHLRWNWATI